MDAWWNEYVVPNVAPPVTGADNRLLSTLYPQDQGKTIGAPNWLEKWAESLGGGRDSMALAKEIREEAEAEIKAVMGDATEIIGEDWKATWKKSKDGETTDWKEVVGDLRTATTLHNNPTLGVLTLQEIDDAIKARTEPKVGSRMFLVYGIAKTRTTD